MFAEEMDKNWGNLERGLSLKDIKGITWHRFMLISLIPETMFSDSGLGYKKFLDVINEACGYANTVSELPKWINEITEDWAETTINTIAKKKLNTFIDEMCKEV